MKASFEFLYFIRPVLGRLSGLRTSGSSGFILQFRFDLCLGYSYHRSLFPKYRRQLDRSSGSIYCLSCLAGRSSRVIHHVLRWTALLDACFGWAVFTLPFASSFCGHECGKDPKYIRIGALSLSWVLNEGMLTQLMCYCEFVVVNNDPYVIERKLSPSWVLRLLV